ncbi:hypothetical protein MHYP_G00228610 [Metynnis hypsauchen]
MALIPLLLLAALLPYLSHSASVNVGIINGTETSPHSRPYMVSIQKYGSHACGGFLVSTQFVMTAAHCWNRREKLTAVLGAHDLSNKAGAVRMEVASYYPHPLYNSVTMDYDILLLKLLGAVKMGQTISPITLPQSNQDIPVNTICIAAGWGRIGTFKPISNRLLETKIRIISSKECKLVWGQYANSQKLCAVHPGGVCSGDSGGPLVCENIAVGISSFIQSGGCDKPTLPNVFAKISAFLPWIKSEITLSPNSTMNLISLLLLTDLLPYLSHSDKKDGSIRMKVKKYYRHLKYKADTHDNGIMLVKLRGKAKKSKTVNWISISKTNEGIKANTVCSLAAWAGTGSSDHGSERLMETNITIMDETECNKLWENRLTPRMMCALHPGGSCKGDSGDPLVCGDTAVGIAAFGQKDNCDAPTEPTVFTKISEFLPWIKSVIGKV